MASMLKQEDFFKITAQTARETGVITIYVLYPVGEYYLKVLFFAKTPQILEFIRQNGSMLKNSTFLAKTAQFGDFVHQNGKHFSNFLFFGPKLPKLLAPPNTASSIMPH